MRKVVIVDRDGTLIKEPRDKQVDSLEKLEFVPGAVSGMKLLTEAGFYLVMATNQDGLGSPGYPRRKFLAVQGKILKLLAGEGVAFERIFICPHFSSDRCRCRKPKTGLVDRFLRNGVDLPKSFVLGDRDTDVEFAGNLGLRAVQITSRRSSAEFATPHLLEACLYIVRSARSAMFRRKTNETDISASVTLDGSGSSRVGTGIGFFDHMIAQLARHSGMDVRLSARGDLEIDEHHTVEDSGIVLGEVIRESLGNKRGIRRFAFSAPLDESIASTTLDLSGRSFLSFQCDFKRERVGEFPTELVEDFFRAFAGGLRASLHITCRGRNDHHKIEAIFKSVALALRDAIRIDDRMRAVLPTTKGLL